MVRSTRLVTTSDASEAMEPKWRLLFRSGGSAPPRVTCQQIAPDFSVSPQQLISSAQHILSTQKPVNRRALDHLGSDPPRLFITRQLTCYTRLLSSISSVLITSGSISTNHITSHTSSLHIATIQKQSNKRPLASLSHSHRLRSPPPPTLHIPDLPTAAHAIGRRPSPRSLAQRLRFAERTGGRMSSRGRVFANHRPPDR